LAVLVISHLGDDSRSIQDLFSKRYLLVMCSFLVREKNRNLLVQDL
jgi:hypothetical protein